MTLQHQLLKIKQNWLLILLVIVLIAGLNFFRIDSFDLSQKSIAAESFGVERSFSPIYQDSFSPEIKERSIAKTSSLSLDIKRGTFSEKDSEIKNLVEEKDGLIVNENRNKIESERKSYTTAYYEIKISTANYDSLLEELKKLGNIKIFNENSDDITEQKRSIENELAAERSRLASYQKILNEAASAEEKLQIIDRIFQQERTIKYLEDVLKSSNERVSYSTIYLTIEEKKSVFAASFISLSSIVSSFVSSINALVKLIIIVLPWALIIYIIYKIYKRKN